MSSTVLPGVAASPGVAIGPAFILPRPARQAEADRPAGAVGTEETPPLPLQPAADEQGRWHEARTQVERAYQQLSERAREVAGDEEAAIFEAQGLMATDPELEQSVAQAIGAGHAAEEATRLAIEEYATALASLGDEYLRQRADDMREIGQALVRALRGEDPVPLAKLPHGAIVCSPELSAGTLLLLDRTRLAGLALGSGGGTSHVAILARTFGIPSVVGLGNALLDTLQDGALVAVDGTRGVVTIAPADATLAALERERDAYVTERASLAGLVGQPATTLDGFHVDIWANIGGPVDVGPALEAGAEGVGLFRTEFLITGRETLPDEDEQYRIYRHVLEQMGQQRPVVFRTFDIGGDKPVPALGLAAEANPFLGYRAVRIGLDRPDLLTTQMRAILRAAEGGFQAWIMLPMVATLDEVVRARVLFDVARRGLEHVTAPLGIMVEIPSAALNAAVLARAVDFFSIGTNDLVQYTLAVDRLNERVAALYQPFDPAVLRLIHTTAQAAATAGIPCGVCGEMAGDPRATALLLGLGVTELSMSAGAIGYVKREVRAMSLQSAQALAREALECATAADVLARVKTVREAIHDDTDTDDGVT